MYCGPDPEPDDLTFEEKLLYIPGGFTRPDCYLGRIRIAGVDRYGEAEELGEGELQLRNAFRTPGDMKHMRSKTETLQSRVAGLSTCHTNRNGGSRRWDLLDTFG